MISEKVISQISLIVVNYNSGNLLLKCIESAISQVDEIVVVDNASCDDSFTACVKYFTGQLKVKFFKNEKNLGFAAGCNIGYFNAINEVILFLNPDCQIAVDSVIKLHQTLVSDPQIGMVGGFLVNPDGTEQGGGRRAAPTPWGSFVRAFGLYRFAHHWPKLCYDFHLNKEPLPKHPVDVDAISGACMMVKREAVDDVGLWDEGYFLHCEDLDWCMCFRSKGWKILFVPSARVTHMLGACSINRPVFVEFHKHKGMARYCKKFFRYRYPLGFIELLILGIWFRFAFMAGLKIIRHGRRNIRL